MSSGSFSHGAAHVVSNESDQQMLLISNHLRLSKFRIDRYELMTSSWKENPSERTQFTDIARKLESCLGKVYEVGFFLFPFVF